MISREGAIKKFIENYQITVPQEAVEEEYKIILMDVRHRMTYSSMAGGPHLNPLEQRAALKDMEEELQQAAYYNVKEELVMKELLEKEEFAVSQEELQNFAEGMARKQNTTMEMIKRFFGEDLSMLAQDVKRQKAEDWIYAQEAK